jgi:peptidoglycan/xylan/chitin deacetylase (PgdA/CDA1 family)
LVIANLDKRRLAARVAGARGVRELIHHAARLTGALVLTYHRIVKDPTPDSDPSPWGVSAGDFDAHVRILAEFANVVAPTDLPALARGVRAPRARGPIVAITLDDGYRDNYEHAFPILREHGVPAGFFVATGLIDGRCSSWWEELRWIVRNTERDGLPATDWLPVAIAFDEPDRNRARRALESLYKALPGDLTDAFLDAIGEAAGTGRRPLESSDGTWMSWDMLREMRAAGMTIGGHTDTHPVLARLPADRQEHEIATCAARLEAELGEPMEVFSYPIGMPESFDADSRRCLQAHGVKVAFSCYGGRGRFDAWDPLDVPRSTVGSSTTVAEVAAMATVPRLFARW